MKASVEYRDLKNLRADDAVHRLDCFEFEPIVRGREFDLLGDGRTDFGSQWRAFAIDRAAVHDAMADDVDFRVFREERF